MPISERTATISNLEMQKNMIKTTSMQCS